MRFEAKRSFLVLLVFLLILSGGCLRGASQLRRRGEAPEIPEEIRTGRRSEPELIVYFAEDGTRKKMRIEEYLAGVVAGEMDPSWPREALAAQAIVARTFTLERIDRASGVLRRNAHASTDEQEFQAYDASRVNRNIRDAINATRGMVMVYNGQYAKAWFSANAGGKTATAREGLNYTETEVPYLSSVNSPDDQDPNLNWEETFTGEEIRQAVREVSGQLPGDFRSIRITKKGPSGRAVELSIDSVTVNAAELRITLGSDRMRSTLIRDIKVSDSGVTFRGRGFGHGVGMSQWGAKALAEDGKSAEEIIEYYYPGVTIKKFWD